jgi:hypothetical protein
VNDDEFVYAFLSGALSPAQFHHQDHVRLAWCLIRKSGPEEAGQTIRAAIRHFAAAHGQSSKYHETLTQFWMRLVSHLIDTRPEISVFETFLRTFPYVLDKELPYHHWSRETMGSTLARAEWVEPDLLALPA